MRHVRRKSQLENLGPIQKLSLECMYIKSYAACGFSSTINIHYSFNSYVLFIFN